jgi:NTP pyrophosphatase (non-canonical NTP hydrolase)
MVNFQEHVDAEAERKNKKDKKIEDALNELANKVVNLAKQLDRHMNEADAHNPGTLKKKK